MSVEIKATGDGACLFNAIAIHLGLAIILNKLDTNKDSPGYIALVKQFGEHHPNFRPITWDNLKKWLGFYNNPRDLELVLAPVLFKLNKTYNKSNQPIFEDLVNLMWQNHDKILNEGAWHELTNNESGVAWFPRLDSLPLSSRNKLLAKLKELLALYPQGGDRSRYKEFMTQNTQVLLPELIQEINENQDYQRGYSCDDAKEMMTALVINIIENNSSTPDKNKFNIHLSNKDSHWNVLCNDDDASHLRSGQPALTMTSAEAYAGTVTVNAPAIEPITSQASSSAVLSGDQAEIRIFDERIDNPGRGNCGFYAFAIGLINIIKDENAYSSKQMFNRWVALNPEIKNEFNAIINFNFQTPDNDLLNRLQSYLRFTLYHHKLNELKSACAYNNAADNYTKLTANSIFTNFAALYYKVPANIDPSYNEFARSPLIKEAIASLGTLTVNKENTALVPLFIELLYGKVDFKTLTEDSYPLDTSPILGLLQQITADFEWAQHLDLDYLSRAFQLNLHILDNGKPRWAFKDTPGLHTIALNNENNSHWTTQVKFAKAFNCNAQKVSVAVSTASGGASEHVPNQAQDRPSKSKKRMSVSFADQVQTVHSNSNLTASKQNNTVDKLERLRQKVANVTGEYLEYNSSVWYSIFHRHGKTGRNRAEAFNNIFASLGDYECAKRRLVQFLADPSKGNTHPHSYRTMLLNELLNNGQLPKISLQQTSKGFDSQLKRLAHDLDVVMVQPLVFS